MKKQTVIKHFGGITATAKALKISPQAVFLWGDEIPCLRAYQIEVITNGKLKDAKEVSHDINTGSSHEDNKRAVS